MKIQDLDDVITETDDYNSDSRKTVVDAKRVLVGAGARILFYPTLLYNVFRNRMEPEFRWWDEIDEVIHFLTYSLVYNFEMFDFS